MPDAFSSPQHPQHPQHPPSHRTHPHQQHGPQQPAAPAFPAFPPRRPDRPSWDDPAYGPNPPGPQAPPYPGGPGHRPDPPHLTYPWQPRPEPPEPARRRPPLRRSPGQHSDIRVLRGAYRRQRRVATLTALGYFTLFLLLSAFAPSLMTSTVSGGLSTGLLLGLLQLPVTCLAIGLYERTARRQRRPDRRPHPPAGRSGREAGGGAMTGFSSSAQAMSLVAFTAVATVTLLLCVMTGPDRDDLDEFYTGYGSLSPMRNGLAIAGDYISAATVLGTGGVIALAGYDGVVLALSTALSLMLLMFLLAEPLRNAGRFTMGDALTRRAPGRAVRNTACAVTIVALLPLMLVQLAGAGDLLAFVLGFSGDSLKTGCIIGLGALMISYAAIGGMKGTALIQILKIVMLLGSGAVVAALVLNRFDWDPGALLDSAAADSGAGAAYLHSGLQFAGGASPRLDMVTSELTVVLGGACLPHVTMRMYTARSARQVRRSLSWAVSCVALFVLIISVIGFGATALVGRDAVAAGDPQGNTAYLLGSRAALGTGVSTAETLLFTTVTTAIFLTLLASVAGMILACANSLAHDVFAHSRLHPGPPPRRHALPPPRDAPRPPLGPGGGRAGRPARHPHPAPQPATPGHPVVLPGRLGDRAGAGLQPLLAPVHPGRAARHTDRRHPHGPGPDARHQPGLRLPGRRLPGRRRQLVPVHHHRHRLDPARLRLRLARHGGLGPPQGGRAAPAVRGGGGLDPGRGGAPGTVTGPPGRPAPVPPATDGPAAVRTAHSAGARPVRDTRLLRTWSMWARTSSQRSPCSRSTRSVSRAIRS